MAKDVIIIGAGGHGKVVADIVQKSGDRVLGFLDDNASICEVMGIPVLGKIEDCDKYNDKSFIIAIGENIIRKKVAEKYNYLQYCTAIHPDSCIAYNVKIGAGTAVMANAVINSSADIGEHCIINTASVVEHDNTIEDFVHISPGAVLCGSVKVHSLTQVGAGVTVKNNVSICGDCIIGVAAAVVKDILLPGVYVGVPAKKIK